MELRIADIIDESVVDGFGIRMAVYTQGCNHNCAGCHNPATHDFAGGRTVDTDEITAMYDKNFLLDGITFSGGEPFEQGLALSVIARHVHEKGGNIWCYSGYTLGELKEKAKSDAGVSALLSQVDVLVDGRFELKNRDLRLKFRGSSNQRVIDMKKSLALPDNEVIELNLIEVEGTE